MNWRKKLLLSATTAVLVAGIILTMIWVYSVGQLRALKIEGIYANPEEGMRRLIARSYSGVNKVEIVHAGSEIFDELWFVEAHVWAARRSDGKGFTGRDYDNPGSFFLRVQNGWVFVPEGKVPEFIAFGKWLFGLS